MTVNAYRWEIFFYELIVYHDVVQVCVDIFITTQSYVDIASISVVPKTTGGQVQFTVIIGFNE